MYFTNTGHPSRIWVRHITIEKRRKLVDFTVIVVKKDGFRFI